MSIKVQWLDETHTAVLWQCSNTFTNEDFHLALYRTGSIVPEQHNFDVVVNLSRTYYAPPGFLPTLRSTRMVAPSNFGLAIIADANPYLRAMLSVANTMSGLKGRCIFVSSMRMACYVIQERHSEDLNGLDAATKPVGSI